MNDLSTQLNDALSMIADYEDALSALRHLPDHCAIDVSELARLIGVEKLMLIRWSRMDLKFARLVASKVRA